ncbi:MAG: hypothetical protein V7K40_24130 [Nostoc sp.]
MTITISRNLFWDVYFEVEQTKQRYDPILQMNLIFFGSTHLSLAKDIAGIFNYARDWDY